MKNLLIITTLLLSIMQPKAVIQNETYIDKFSFREYQASEVRRVPNGFTIDDNGVWWSEEKIYIFEDGYWNLKTWSWHRIAETSLSARY